MSARTWSRARAVVSGPDSCETLSATTRFVSEDGGPLGPRGGAPDTEHQCHRGRSRQHPVPPGGRECRGTAARSARDDREPEEQRDCFGEMLGTEVGSCRGESHDRERDRRDDPRRPVVSKPPTGHDEQHERHARNQMDGPSDVLAERRSGIGEQSERLTEARENAAALHLEVGRSFAGEHVTEQRAGRVGDDERQHHPRDRDEETGRAPADRAATTRHGRGGLSLRDEESRDDSREGRQTDVRFRGKRGTTERAGRTQPPVLDRCESSAANERSSMTSAPSDSVTASME